jgi:hypothetical protein
MLTFGCREAETARCGPEHVVFGIQKVGRERT